MNGKYEWKPNTNVLVSNDSEKRGNDEDSQLHIFSCSFLSIFLYGEEAFLKDYLYLFSKTYSHNKVEKFQKIL